MNKKTFTTMFNPVFLMLLIVKSFEILPEHGIYVFSSEFFFVLNWYIFEALTNKKILLPL